MLSADEPWLRTESREAPKQVLGCSDYSCPPDLAPAESAPMVHPLNWPALVLMRGHSQTEEVCGLVKVGLRLHIVLLGDAARNHQAHSAL